MNLKFFDSLQTMDTEDKRELSKFEKFVIKCAKRDPSILRNHQSVYSIGKIYPSRWERRLKHSLDTYLQAEGMRLLEKAFSSGVETVMDETAMGENFKKEFGTVRKNENGGASFEGEPIPFKVEDSAPAPVYDGKGETFGDFMDELKYIASKIIEYAEDIFSDWVKMTVGVPYYPEERTAAIKRNWINNFEILCESANTETKKYIANEIWTAKQHGQNKREIYKAVENQYRAEIEKAKTEARKAAVKKEMEAAKARELSKAYDKLKADIKEGLEERISNKAELVSRTETGKLNQAATRAIHEEVGINYYQWHTTIDGRERESHALLNRLICSHEDPAAQYIENEDSPGILTRENRPAGSFEGEPGEDFQCRCSCTPYIPILHSKYRDKILERLGG